jgi:hypothetical protein
MLIKLQWKRPAVVILGVSRLVDITAGGDFLGLCDQKSLYKLVFDFGRLQSYGHIFNSRTRPRVNRVFGISWRVTYSTWWLIICVASTIIATWIAHPATDSPVFVFGHLEGIK